MLMMYNFHYCECTKHCILDFQKLYAPSIPEACNKDIIILIRVANLIIAIEQLL